MPARQMEKLSESDAAYLAGLCDIFGPTRRNAPDWFSTTTSD